MIIRSVIKVIFLYTYAYALRCGTEELSTSDAYANIWIKEPTATDIITTQGEEGEERGTLRMRVIARDWISHEWIERTHDLMACARKDWQQVLKEENRQTEMYYHVDECEVHEMVRIRMTYRVVD